MPLLGRKEKGELEEMILERLVAHWNANGADALVAEGVCVVLDARGPRIDVAHGEELASVEIRTLFTALCCLSADGPGALPRDSLDSLASEATSALAAKVNRIVPD